MMRLGLLVGAAFAASIGVAAAADDVSVAFGKHISIIGGCHDCHTVGYEQGGKIDPDAALKGNPVGYGGPWGVNYAKNLRLVASTKSEDDWVTYLQTLQAGPPMPWYNVHELTEAEMRSLYQYIKSLGAPGDPVPADVPPGGTPTTPYIVMAPPVMPQG